MNGSPDIVQTSVKRFVVDVGIGWVMIHLTSIRVDSSYGYALSGGLIL